MTSAPDMEFDDGPAPQPAESFETALPVATTTTPKRPVTPEREMPASEEAEQHVIACCLLDGTEDQGHATLTRARAHGLTPASFFWPNNQLLFEYGLNALAAGAPFTPDTLAEELTANRKLDAIGGLAYLMSVTGKTPTTAHAGYFINRVKELHLRREIIRAATGAVEQAYQGTDPEEIRGLLQRAILPPTQQLKTQPRPITSYSYPSEDDPNILLGRDDYLGRGGGMLFVSHAGAGKSSWIMDACMMWAIGRSWMGIRCSGPLKTVIVQAEDSDRYIGKIFSSFAHVNNLTPEQTEMLTKNCRITRLKGVSGEAFLTELKSIADAEKPDLLIINPLYLYADGDISRSEFAQPFLLGLDRINKEERFAYILVHHTGKPAAKQNGKRVEVEDWESAYMGFGSSYLANWPRCTALLEPTPGNPGRYCIKLGKGGLNAGVTKEVAQGAGVRHETTTRIHIKHSTSKMPVGDQEKPVYYWEIDGEPPSAESQKPAGKPMGAAVKYDFADYRSLFPPKSGPGMSLNELHRALIPNGEIKKTTLPQTCKRWAKESMIEIIEVHGQPLRYRSLA